MKRIVSHCVLFVFAALFHLAAAFSQTEVSFGPARPDSPKTVSFKLVRMEEVATDEGVPVTFDLERLTNSTIVLERDGAEFISSPIKIQDSAGSCIMRNIAPGRYRLKLSMPRLSNSIRIPSRPVNGIKIVIKLGGSVTVSVEPDK